MVAETRHIIRNQYIDVIYHGNESEGFFFQRQLSELSYELFIPALENAFNKCSATDEHVYIDHLEVDLGNLPHAEFESELKSIVENKVVEAIRDMLAMNTSLRSDSHSSYSIKSNQEWAWEVFSHFLEKGYLPWNCKRLATQSFADFLNELSFSELSKTKIDSLVNVLNNENACLRLLNQGALEFVTHLLDSLIEKRGLLVSKDLNNYEKLKALQFDTEPSGSDMYVKPDNTFRDGNETIHDQINFREKLEGIYIENAGLVLLYPFLPQLFNALEIAHDTDIVFPDRALSILFYLTYGENEIE